MPHEINREYMMSRKCYLCNTQKFTQVEGKVRDLPDMPILKCKECGLVFLENFNHIDEGFYEESKMRSDKDISDWDVYIQESLVDDLRRAEWIKEKVLNKSVLDFGCGAGGFLSKIKDCVKRCSGVEKDRSLQRIIKNKFNVYVYPDIEDVNEKFEVITLFHVLEHFKDPEGLLVRLSKLLENDGHIIVEVPNSNDALLSLYKSKAFSEFTYWGCHLYLFNDENLKKLVEKAGLSIDYVQQIQRYPLSNHLYWLAEGKPGGHKKWDSLDSEELNKLYERSLGNLGICDTIMASIKVKDEHV